MAGRGTDIKINDEVKALGGLCVFGTERHESRRIDNQLRGRSGRQGDPGFSRFYVSFDDDLLKRFAAESIQARIESFGPGPLESKLFSAVITNAQKQIEGQNFDIRKNLLDYDDVISRQRKAIYEKRDAIIYAEDITDRIEEFFRVGGYCLARKALPEGTNDDLISGALLKKVLEPKFVPEGSFNEALYDEAPLEDAGQDLGDFLLDNYYIRRKQWGEDIAKKVERDICLQTIDQNWTKQIDTMARLREGIHLRSYANTNPLQDYVNEGQALFRECLENISQEVVFKFLNVIVQIKKPVEEAPKEEPEATKPAEEDVVDVESKDKKE
jgi:preprotein translocase subunit SecA